MTRIYTTRIKVWAVTRHLVLLAFLPVLAYAQQKPDTPAIPATSYFEPPSRAGSYVVHEALTSTTGFVLVGRNGPFSIPDQGGAEAVVLDDQLVPANAIVTRIDYRFKIQDEGNGAFFCGDYDIFISSHDTPFASQEVRILDFPFTRNDEGADDDPENDNDIEIEWRTTDSFKGDPVNQYWGMWINDGAAGDDGELAYFEYRIYYKVADEMMYWANSRDRWIQRAPVTGTLVEDLVTTGLLPRDITLDLTAGKMYWADASTKKIHRANLDGSTVEDLITVSGNPGGIALDLAEGKIYWIENAPDKIRRANLDGTSVQDLITTGLNGTDRIALDLTVGKMYWTRLGPGMIQRANLDGSSVENLITTGIEPNGIALDVAAGKIYWTDDTNNKIQRANLDGSSIENLVTTGLDKPDAITLDPFRGKIYWTDWGTKKIQRANLDGSSIKDMVTTGLTFPYGIALDPAAGKMYWTDASFPQRVQRAGYIEILVTGLGSVGEPTGIALDMTAGKMYWTRPGSSMIQRANLNGSSVENLITTGLTNPERIALDVAAGKMYWTDYGTQKIQRANMDGTSVQDLVTGLSLPLGIALDVAADKMYWLDAQTNKIQRANMDGTSVQDLVTGLPSLNGDIGLDLMAGKMYWGSDGNLRRANLDGSAIENLSPVAPSGLALDVSGGKIYMTSLHNITRANLDGTSETLLLSAVSGTEFEGIALSIPPPPSNLKVYFKRPVNWGLPHIHYTSTTPDIGTTSFPGLPMVNEGCGWYSYFFQGAHTATFSFNGHPVDPAPQTVSLTRDRKGFFLPDAPGGGSLTGTWYDANLDPPCNDQVELQPKIWLQGPFDTGTNTMTTDLQTSVPISQPYAEAPFPGTNKVYGGSETRDGESVYVDWALVQLRIVDTDPVTTIETKAGLLTEDGDIVDPVTEGPLIFKVPDGNYHIVVRHRNHLSVISPQVSLSVTPTVYDFTVDATQALGVNPMIELAPGNWGLWGGDGNASEETTAFDFLNTWLPINGGPPGYDAGDFDMNGSATAFDFLNVWLPANGQASQVP